MSLKAFHLVFIAASVILAVFVAAWAVGQYQAARETEYLGAGIASAAAAVALTVYAAAFQRKTRRM